MFSPILLYCSGIASITDLEKREIPPEITSPLFILGVIVSLISKTFTTSFLQSMLILVLGFILFLTMGVGAADVKILMSVPFYVNIQSFLLICLLLSVVYGLFGFNKQDIAFAPFIFGSTLGLMII